MSKRQRKVRGLTAAVLALAALGLHAWQLVELFPALRAIVDDRPVLTVDHALHLYHGFLGARALRTRGVVCGYDPAFMAGYRRTPIFDPSANLAELSQLPFRTLNPAAYKAALVMAMFLVPVLVGGGTWLLTGSATPAAVAALATVLYWWVGYPNGLLRSGLVAYLWSAGLATLLACSLERHDGKWGPTRWCGLALLGAAGLQSHPTFAIQALPVCMAWLLTRARRSWRWWAATAACVAVAAATASPWLVPLVAHLRVRTTSAPFLQTSGTWFFADYWWGQWSYRADAHIPTILLAWLLAALFACPRLALSVPLLWLHLFYLALLTFLGSLWGPVRSIEPLRFQVPMVLALIVITATGWGRIVGAVMAGGMRRWRAACTIGLATLVTVISAARATIPAARVRLTMDRPLRCGYTAEMLALVGFLKAHTTNEHRVLFEDQLRLWEATDPESTHWTPLLPLLTGRSFIGGLYELAPVPEHYASFGDFHLAGRRIDHWQPDELADFLRTYNVGWVVTWSRRSRPGDPPRSTEVFESLPFCRIIARIPRYSTRPTESVYTIFEVRLDSSWAIEGEAVLAEAGFDRLLFENVCPDPRTGRAVLAFHYDPGLVCREGLRLFPVFVGEDPVPFVGLRLDSPRKRLTLEFRWGPMQVRSSRP